MNRRKNPIPIGRYTNPTPPAILNTMDDFDDASTIATTFTCLQHEFRQNVRLEGIQERVLMHSDSSDCEEEWEQMEEEELLEVLNSMRSKEQGKGGKQKRSTTKKKLSRASKHDNDKLPPWAANTFKPNFDQSAASKDKKETPKEKVKKTTSTSSKPKPETDKENKVSKPNFGQSASKSSAMLKSSTAGRQQLSKTDTTKPSPTTTKSTVASTLVAPSGESKFNVQLPPFHQSTTKATPRFNTEKDSPATRENRAPSPEIKKQASAHTVPTVTSTGTEQTLQKEEFNVYLPPWLDQKKKKKKKKKAAAPEPPSKPCHTPTPLQEEPVQDNSSSSTPQPMPPTSKEENKPTPQAFFALHSDASTTPNTAPKLGFRGFFRKLSLSSMRSSTSSLLSQDTPKKSRASHSSYASQSQEKRRPSFSLLPAAKPSQQVQKRRPSLTPVPVEPSRRPDATTGDEKRVESDKVYQYQVDAPAQVERLKAAKKKKKDKYRKKHAMVPAPKKIQYMLNSSPQNKEGVFLRHSADEQPQLAALNASWNDHYNNGSNMPHHCVKNQRIGLVEILAKALPDIKGLQCRSLDANKFELSPRCVVVNEENDSYAGQPWGMACCTSPPYDAWVSKTHSALLETYEQRNHNIRESVRKTKMQKAVVRLAGLLLDKKAGESGGEGKSGLMGSNATSN